MFNRDDEEEEEEDDDGGEKLTKDVTFKNKQKGTFQRWELYSIILFLEKIHSIHTTN